MSATLIDSREKLSEAECVVVKVGSSLLADLDGGVDKRFVKNLVRQLAALKNSGKEVVLVSSGAVAAGCVELGFESRPTEMPTIQAAAAVGQNVLMELYRNFFREHGIVTGQVLLTRDGLHERQRFLYARNTMRELIKLGVVAVVNENDTVAIEELKLKMGDNDSLAVSVAQLVNADCLVILTDVTGLYDRNPEEDEAAIIDHVHNLTDEIRKNAGGTGSSVGSGGMSSKVNAAQAAAMASIPMLVAGGKEKDILLDIFNGKNVGTFFAPKARRTNSRGQWIAFSRRPAGKLLVDQGAVKALTTGKKSLLAIGVKKIEGEFEEGDTVSVICPDGHEIARGLVNFNSTEMQQIAGRHSDDFEKILGYAGCITVLYRDNIVVLD